MDRSDPTGDFIDGAEAERILVGEEADGEVLQMMEAQNRPQLDHNVYILGAGFSFDGGLPLLNNFLERMGDCLDWLIKQDRQREMHAIQQVFALRFFAAGAAYRANINVENIEELFSLVSASEGEQRTEHITTAIAATLDFARITAPPVTCRCVRIIDDTLKEARDNLSLYQLYAEINGNLHDEPSANKNSVITFNYDTLLEDGLASSGIEFTYGLPEAAADYQVGAKCSKNVEDTTFPVYKLHGSVNWSVESPSSQKVKVYWDYSDVAKNERILLVPPTWRKVFGDHLTSVWDKSVRAISEATRIVVLGFSMPPTDTHFKYLLIAGLQTNISLRRLVFVNPGLDESKHPRENKRLRENVFGILRPELEERGMIELIPESTMQFLLQNRYRQMIGRNCTNGRFDISTRSVKGFVFSN
jgi:hypothetical protein